MEQRDLGDGLRPRPVGDEPRNPGNPGKQRQNRLERVAEMAAPSDEILNLISPHGDAPRVRSDRLVYSCLMDNKPKYIRQTFVLLWTLLDLARVLPQQIIVHAIEGCDEATLSALGDLGVRLHMVMPFAEGFPNCNKLRQIATPELLEADAAVLLDTDTAVLQDVSRAACSRNVRARSVGRTVPPIDMLTNIFQQAGFNDMPAVGKTTYDARPTFRVNCNGGVYFLPRLALEGLSKEWPERARWLISTGSLDKRFQFFLDQISFGLACHALQLDIDLLPIEMNYQIRKGKPDPDLTPVILHYHDHTNPSGLLSLTDKPNVNLAIEQVNSVIMRRRRHTFNSDLV